MSKTGFYRTQSGWVMEIDHPLSEDMRGQVLRRDLIRVANEKGDAYNGDTLDQDQEGFPMEERDQHTQDASDVSQFISDPAQNRVPVPPDQVAGGPLLPAETPMVDYDDGSSDPMEPARPAKSAPKDEWIGYARQVDPDLTADDADAMTKADLVEKYGK